MIINTETRNNFAWYSDSCPEDYKMFDTESINLSQSNRNTDRAIVPNSFNKNDWQINDPGKQDSPTLTSKEYLLQAKNKKKQR